MSLTVASDSTSDWLDSLDTNQTRVVKKFVPTDSFFSFFSPPTPPTGEEDEEDEDDDIDEKLELDYQIGEDLKERVIPRAIDFFTGKALRQEQDGQDYDSEEFDDDEDEEESEDDSEDDAPRGKGSKVKAPIAPESHQVNWLLFRGWFNYFYWRFLLFPSLGSSRV